MSEQNAMHAGTQRTKPDLLFLPFGTREMRADAVLIDGRSPWSNPFAGERDAAARYRELLWQQLRSGERELADLATLCGRRLAVLGVSGTDHAQVLADAAVWANRRQAGGLGIPASESRDNTGPDVTHAPERAKQQAVSENPQAVPAYDSTSSVVLRDADTPFGSLIPEAPLAPGAINGIFFRTAHALYLACLYPHLPTRQQELALCETDREVVLCARARAAKDARYDWEQVRNKAMAWALAVRLAHNWRRVRIDLLATGSCPIVRGDHQDQYWGAVRQPDGTLVGQNWVGRFLQVQRRAIQSRRLVIGGEIRPPRIGGFLVGAKEVSSVAIEDSPPRKQRQ